MRRISSLLFFAFFASVAGSVGALVGGCDGGGPPAPTLESFALSDGSEVQVVGGAVELRVGERVLWASPEGAFPTARTFGEAYNAPIGIWDFRRGGLQERVFDRYLGAAEAGGGVEVSYAERGSEARAVLTIAPGGQPSTSRLSLRVDLDGAGAEADSIALPIRCDAEGSFHGFGEQYNATDQRGEAFELFVSEQGIGREGGGARLFAGDRHTTYFPMPYYLDARGFGLLFDTAYRTLVDACATDPEVAWIEPQSGAPVTATVFWGPSALEVIAQLSEVVGRPAPPPEWAFRLWISKQGGQDIVRAEVDALEAAGVPFSAIWSQDWTGVRMNIGGGFGVEYRWQVDTEDYPDLPALTAELHARGYRFLAYANPFVANELRDHFPEMAERGLLIRGEDGEPYSSTAPNGFSSHPDFTNPEADAYVRAALSAMVTELGIDGWMADFGEWTPLDGVLADSSDPRAYHNLFPVDWHRVNREAMDAARPDGDWVLFARSGWSGVQRHSMIHWVGDQEADFGENDGLPTVVPAMLNLGLAGVPYVAHDIAGFSGGPSTKELFLRWTELGAFTPIMRTHEGNQRDLNWNWDRDAETTAHFRRFARIHEALLPEMMALSEEAQRSSAPLVRHLMLVFPEDQESRAIHDQYMLGGSLLVAPVVHEGATERELYLPPGEWFHVFTGERFEGGRRITVAAPIGAPPVFSLGADRADLRAIE